MLSRLKKLFAPSETSERTSKTGYTITIVDHENDTEEVYTGEAYFAGVFDIQEQRIHVKASDRLYESTDSDSLKFRLWGYVGTEMLNRMDPKHELWSLLNYILIPFSKYVILHMSEIVKAFPEAKNKIPKEIMDVLDKLEESEPEKFDKETDIKYN